MNVIYVVANHEEDLGVVAWDCVPTAVLRGHVSDRCPFSSTAISILEVAWYVD